MTFGPKLESSEALFEQFGKRYQLSDLQLKQFKQYLLLLQQFNKMVNLTAVQSDFEIIERHFEDSLALGVYQKMNRLNSLADVGSGAGFPGIPLKIAFPHLQVTLIEVTQKRVNFLQKVIDELGLTLTTVCAQDWRTFLRKSQLTVNCFVSRASSSSFK